MVEEDVRDVSMELIAIGLAAGALLIASATLFVGFRVLRSAHRAEQAGNERLEILREQQERLRVMYQERRMLEEELDRLRSAMAEEEERRRELPAPAKPGQPEHRRMDEVERELDVEQLPRGPQSAAEGRGSGETRPGGVEAQEGAESPQERRGFWSRLFFGE
jgi:hypothetical protein